MKPQEDFSKFDNVDKSEHIESMLECAHNKWKWEDDRAKTNIDKKILQDMRKYKMLASIKQICSNHKPLCNTKDLMGMPKEPDERCVETKACDDIWPSLSDIPEDIQYFSKLIFEIFDFSKYKSQPDEGELEEKNEMKERSKKLDKEMKELIKEYKKLETPIKDFSTFDDKDKERCKKRSIVKRDLQKNHKVYEGVTSENRMCFTDDEKTIIKKYINKRDEKIKINPGFKNRLERMGRKAGKKAGEIGRDFQKKYKEVGITQGAKKNRKKMAENPKIKKKVEAKAKKKCDQRFGSGASSDRTACMQSQSEKILSDTGPFRGIKQNALGDNYLMKNKTQRKNRRDSIKAADKLGLNGANKTKYLKAASNVSHSKGRNKGETKEAYKQRRKTLKNELIKASSNGISRNNTGKTGITQIMKGAKSLQLTGKIKKELEKEAKKYGTNTNLKKYSMKRSFTDKLLRRNSAKERRAKKIRERVEKYAQQTGRHSNTNLKKFGRNATYKRSFGDKIKDTFSLSGRRLYDSKKEVKDAKIKELETEASKYGTNTNLKKYSSDRTLKDKLLFRKSAKEQRAKKIRERREKYARQTGRYSNTNLKKFGKIATKKKKERLTAFKKEVNEGLSGARSNEALLRSRKANSNAEAGDNAEANVEANANANANAEDGGGAGADGNVEARDPNISKV